MCYLSKAVLKKTLQLYCFKDVSGNIILRSLATFTNGTEGIAFHTDLLFLSISFNLLDKAAQGKFYYLSSYSIHYWCSKCKTF